MTTAVFDTLKASRDLKAAGFDDTQAEAIVTTMAKAFDDTVATRVDLHAVQSELKADIANLKAEVFRALWIQGAGIVALIVGLTKLL